MCASRKQVLSQYSVLNIRLRLKLNIQWSKCTLAQSGHNSIYGVSVRLLSLGTIPLRYLVIKQDEEHSLTICAPLFD